MRQTRSRKFLYKIKYKSKENWIEFVKQIRSKYHIFGWNENEIYGFVYFADTKTTSSVYSTFKDKPAGNFDIEYATKSPLEYAVEFKKSVYHEMGEIPRQGNRKSLENEEKRDKLEGKWDEIFEMLIKQNQMLLEENQKCRKERITQPQTIYNTTNIVENKTINIQLFLKEECKDAMSLAEFIRGIHIEDADLIYAKERGLANAILHIFERGLDKCDIKTRPLHCTDISREIMHVKEEDGWVKDTAGMRLTKAITTISNKKMQKLCEFLETHPEYGDSSSPKYEDNLRFIRNIICTDGEQEKTDKVVRKQIAKMVFIPKMIEI
jgi:hypothetical protein